MIPTRCARRCPSTPESASLACGTNVALEVLSCRACRARRRPPPPREAHAGLAADLFLLPRHRRPVLACRARQLRAAGRPPAAGILRAELAIVLALPVVVLM